MDRYRLGVSIQIVLLAFLGCGARGADSGPIVSDENIAMSRADLTVSDGHDGRDSPPHSGGRDGIIVELPDGNQTSETGKAVRLLISLTSPPRGSVTVRAISSDAAEGLPSPAVVFHANGWRRAQAIVVTGQSDPILDGDRTYRIRFEVTAPRDPSYGQVELPDVELVNRDDGGGFVGIGDLTGGDTLSSALGVSADGQVVVGYGAGPAGRQAVRWSPEAGLRALDGLSSEARAVNRRSGELIVGVALDAGGNPAAVRWVNGSGPELLALNSAFSLNSDAKGISGDGQLVVGEAYSRRSPIDFSGVTWSSGRPEGDFHPFGAITGANESGDVLVGYSVPNRASPARLALQNGRALPFPVPSPDCHQPSCGFCDTPGTCDSLALGVSLDGVIAVGWVSFNHAPVFAVAWSPGPAGNPVATVLSSEPGSAALAISGDGKVVVGYEAGAATRWRDGTSSPIAELLAQAGVSTAGWNLTTAQGTSSDGRVIVGEGTNPAGQQEGWVAVLPSLSCGLSH